VKENFVKIIQLILKYKNKIILSLFVFLMIGIAVYTQSQKIDFRKLTLSTEEKFDGTNLSEEWIIMKDGSFQYTGFYSDDQVSVSNGQLRIKLSRVGGDKGDQIYSSVVRSSATYTSGYFEVTATLPKISEFNAIISLTNDNALENTDPTFGATVVFGSSNNQPYPFLATGIYYDNLGDPTETQNTFVLSFLYSEPHRFGLLWTDKSYSFYFDENKLWESNKTDSSTEPMYLTMGFEFPLSTTLEDAEIDQVFLIEGVKIYTINP
jgi:hypothetical protein